MDCLLWRRKVSGSGRGFDGEAPCLAEVELASGPREDVLISVRATIRGEAGIYEMVV